MAAIALVGVWLAPAAIAQTGQEGARTAIVMDGSSSMLEPEGSGTRLDAAKEATNQLIDSLPETAHVGMLAYGTEVTDAPENHARGCQDIRVLAPVETVDKTALHSAVDGLQAAGYTPIGNALRAAAEELGDSGERSIVLVSDGIDTCAPPDPCEVAKELSADGVDLAVHVVGFKADPQARQQLECISKATGGTYRQADDAASLVESLEFLTQRALNPYETYGTEFQFADSVDDAQWLGAGLYQTRVRAEVEVEDATEQFFKVAVPEGYIGRISVTALPNISLYGDNQDVQTRIEALNPQESCSTSTKDSVTTYSGGFEPPNTAVISINPKDREKCDMEQWAVKTVITSADTFGNGQAQDINVEVSVQLEPELDPNENRPFTPGRSGDSGDSAALSISQPQAVSGGNSFNNAATISEGAYSDAIVPGETRFYAFDVDWNQQPVVTIRTGPSARDSADRMGFTVFGPLRHELAGGSLSIYRDPVEESTASVNRPINYLNREMTGNGFDYATAGTHYIAVSMSRGGDDDAVGIEQPYEFALKLNGSTGVGPDWRPTTDPGPAPADAPPSARPADAQAANAGNGGQAVSDDATAAAANTSEAESLPLWATIAIGAGVVLVAGGALSAWLLLSRRK